MINIHTINDIIHQNLGINNCKFETDSTDQACDFISRNYQCLEPQYLEIVKKTHNYIRFNDCGELQQAKTFRICEPF